MSDANTTGARRRRFTRLAPDGAVDHLILENGGCCIDAGEASERARCWVVGELAGTGAVEDSTH